jgi:hypothetical protein
VCCVLCVVINVYLWQTFCKFLTFDTYQLAKKKKVHDRRHTRLEIHSGIWHVIDWHTFKIETTCTTRHVTLRWYFRRKCRGRLTFIFCLWKTSCDVQGFGKSPDIAYQHIPKKLDLTWGVKGLIVTRSNLVVTWKDSPQMSIISWSPLRAALVQLGLLYFGSFLQLNFQFARKSLCGTLALKLNVKSEICQTCTRRVVMSHVLGICTVFFCFYIYIYLYFLLAIGCS